MKSLLKIFLFFLFSSSTLSSARAQFWRQTNGPCGYGGYVIAFDSSGSVFAANDNVYGDGGVFRSTDDGTSWRHRGLLHISVLSLAVDHSGTVYAGTGSAGIFKSTNQGATWTQVNNGLTTFDVRSLVVRPQGDMFAATSGGGIFTSTDGGLQWLRRSSGLPDTTINAPFLSVDSFGTLFSTTDSSGIFRSTNAGLDWSPSSSGLTNRRTKVVVADPNDILYATTPGGAYRSTNSGNSWTPVNTGLHNQLAEVMATNQIGHVFCGLLSGEVYRSTNHGETWDSLCSFGISGPRFLAANRLEHVFLANMNGIFRSTNNGGQWTQCSLPNSSILALGSHRNGRVFAGVDNAPPGYTADAGLTWVGTSEPLPGVTSIVINSSGMIFMSSLPIIRSTDGGDTWTIAGGFPFAILSMVTGNQDVLYMGLDAQIEFGGGGVYRSTDNGTTWACLGFSQQRVFSVAVNSQGHLFAFVHQSGLQRSTDDGVTWTPLPQLTTEVQSLVPTGDNSLLAGTPGNGIFRSTDDGTTWSHVVDNGTTVRSLICPRGGTVLAAVDTQGVLLSTDNGLTWADAITGLEGRRVTCVAVDSAGYAYAGTAGSGVFVSADRVTDTRKGTEGQITQFLLDQNYPNPWNPSTTIRYSLGENSFVSITVFNVLGQEVAQLVNEVQQRGYHELVFGSERLSSGVYLYRIHANHFTMTKKMLVLR